MADVQVTCAVRQPRKNPHEGITHLGGHGWKKTKAEMIAAIEGRRDTFHLMACLLYTSPSPRDRQKSRMPSSA